MYLIPERKVRSDRLASVCVVFVRYLILVPVLLGYTNALVVARVIRVSDSGFPEQSSPYIGVRVSKPYMSE